MKLGNLISVTSPTGTWDYNALIGAKVKIKSSRVFGYDSEEIHTIHSIGFRVNKMGDVCTAVYLEGLTEYFEWKSLEVVSVKMIPYSCAVCGNPLSGQTISGHGV